MAVHVVVQVVVQVVGSQHSVPTVRSGAGWDISHDISRSQDLELEWFLVSSIFFILLAGTMTLPGNIENLPN